MTTNEVLRTDQGVLANDGIYRGREQRWGDVGNRGYDSRRTMNGLGFITPNITGPLGGFGQLPTLVGFGQTTISPRIAAVGLLAIAAAIAGTAFGAYKGAEKSKQWAAGGAVLGLVAAGLVNSVLAAIVSVKATAPDEGDWGERRS
jgi:hypothetical protein